MEASVQNPNKPLLAVPMQAIDHCAKVDFDLGLSKAQAQQQSDFLVNQFELFLKDDFLALYLKQNYEVIMQSHQKSPNATTAADSNNISNLSAEQAGLASRGPKAIQNSGVFKPSATMNSTTEGSRTGD